eukprot:scaffold105943_cov44-Attheya_sp.AAC.1
MCSTCSSLGAPITVPWKLRSEVVSQTSCFMRFDLSCRAASQSTIQCRSYEDTSCTVPGSTSLNANKAH